MNKNNTNIWYNGKITNINLVEVGLLNHSLQYSGGVFEGIRSYDGKIFRLKEHMQRLLASAKDLGLDVSFTVEDLCTACTSLLSDSGLKDTYIRPFIWRQSPTIKIYSPECSTNTAIVILPSAPNYSSAKHMRVQLSKWRKPHPLSLPPQAKSSAHYSMSVAESKRAIENGFDDVLFLDLENNIAECSVSNIFFGTPDKKLYTPIADGFLNGITRQEVIKLAKKLNIEIYETILTIEDLSKFNSCFVTGTSAEIKSIKTIDTNDHQFDFPNMELYEIFRSEYHKLVRS